MWGGTREKWGGAHQKNFGIVLPHLQIASDATAPIPNEQLVSDNICPSAYVSGYKLLVRDTVAGQHVVLVVNTTLRSVAAYDICQVI